MGRMRCTIILLVVATLTLIEETQTETTTLSSAGVPDSAVVTDSASVTDSTGVPDSAGVPDSVGVPYCGGEVCQSCLGDCGGCRSCGLCGVVAEACKRKGTLKLGGKDLCVLCGHCSGGADACMEKCEEGKQSETCRECVSHCTA